MIVHCFYLDKYDWKVCAFYDVTDSDSELIINTLNEIGCSKRDLYDILDNIEDGLTDNGFTYSNCITKQTIIVVGEGTSDELAMNSLVHEARHLQRHISKTFGIDEEDEEIYYLMGKLVQVMYSKFKYTLDK